MSESKLVEAAKKMEEMKKVAIAATSSFPELVDTERRLWSGLAPMIAGADAMDDEESGIISTMFATVAAYTGTQSLCDCAPVLLKYKEAVDLYNKSRYAKVTLDETITTGQRVAIEYHILNGVELFLQLDYGNTGICAGIEPYEVLLGGDSHLSFMADWWTADTVSAVAIAQHNRELVANAAKYDVADILPEKREAVNAVKNASATGGSVAELVRLYSDAMVDVDQSGVESDVLTEQAPVAEPAQPVAATPVAHAIESVVADQVAAIDAENAETIAALQRELDAAQDVFDQNSARAVAVAAPSGAGSSSSSDGMSGWAVAGLCVAAAGAAYLGYRFFTDGDSQDIVDVDIDDYV